MKRGSKGKWTNEEVEYLKELTEVKMADGKPFPSAAIHIFFNNYFINLYGEDYSARSAKAVKIKLGKLAKDGTIKSRHMVYSGNQHDGKAKKPEEIVKQYEDVVEKKVKKPKKKWARVKTRNSGKSWSISEEKYLLNNWTANDDDREDIANHLGRTISSCVGKYSSIKRKKGNKYMTDLMQPSTDLTVNVPRGGLFSRFVSWLHDRNQRKLEAKAQKKAQLLLAKETANKKNREQSIAEAQAQLEQLIEKQLLIEERLKNL
tara:strand:+ start:901 stop:1683 length:783 start_codon:yes stop_codon:yes gene_type:complete